MERAFAVVLAVAATVLASPSFAAICVTAPADRSKVVVPEKQVVWFKPKEHFVYQPSHTDGVQEGEVHVDCTFAPDGTLRDCRVLSETPPEKDLGDNALRFFSTLRADMARSCAEAGMHVHLTMSFKLR